MDISSEALRLASSSLDITSVRFTVADAHNIPAADGSFDLVCCTEIIEHCAEPALVVKECVRVLAPRGYLVMSSPNYFNPAGLWKKMSESWFHRTWDAWGNHEEGIENNTSWLLMRSLILEAGLTIEQDCGGDFLRSWFPFLRSYYYVIDRHPMLWLGKLPIIKFFGMNYFVKAKKGPA